MITKKRGGRISNAVDLSPLQRERGNKLSKNNFLISSHPNLLPPEKVLYS